MNPYDELVSILETIQVAKSSLKHKDYSVNSGNNSFFKKGLLVKNVKNSGCQAYLRGLLRNLGADTMVTTISKIRVNNFIKKLAEYEVIVTLEDIIEEFNKFGFEITISEESRNYKFSQPIGLQHKKAYFGFCLLRHFYYYSSILIKYFIVVDKHPNICMLNRKRVLSSFNVNNIHSFLVNGYWDKNIDFSSYNTEWSSFFIKDLNLETLETIKELENYTYNRYGKVNKEYLDKYFKYIYLGYVTAGEGISVPCCTLAGLTTFTSKGWKICNTLLNIPIGETSEKIKKVYHLGKDHKLRLGTESDKYCVYDGDTPIKINREDSILIKTYVEIALTAPNFYKLCVD